MNTNAGPRSGSASSFRDLELDVSRRSNLSVALVATCPPRQCGIATFTSDLAGALLALDPILTVSRVAIDEPIPVHRYGPEVRWRIQQGNPNSYRAAALALNASDVDVVAIEHEFGLYGAWRDSFEDHLAPFLDALRKPLVSTLHTVLPDPTPSVRQVVQRIGRRSVAVIAMAETARRLLVEDYGLPPERVHVIPHGAPPMTPIDCGGAKQALGLAGRAVVSTFGLVDPRKGLEYAIRAMLPVVARHPEVVYVILGRTHPELVRMAGEAYRDELVRLVESLGLSDHVQFVDRYLDQDEIVSYLRATDVYVTPYLDPNQITSGTLAYALAAGRAIVSTRYLHASEALANGRGILVEFRSADGLAAGMNSLLDDPSLRHTLERNAYEYGRRTEWPIVARRTLDLFSEAAGRPVGRRSAGPSHRIRRATGPGSPLLPAMPLAGAAEPPF